MHKITNILFLFLTAVLLSSCDYFPYFDEEDSDNEVQHTMILYMLADSSLSGYLEEDLRETINAVSQDFSSRARIVVYYDRMETRDKADSTTLFLLKQNNINTETNLERLEVLKTYSRQESTDPLVMQEVLNDVKELVPSRSYGLLISGHGSGWFPKPTNNIETNTELHAQRVGQKPLTAISTEHSFIKQANGPITRWIGNDNYYRFNTDRGRYERSHEETFMSAEELASGLSPIHFDYIIFDACFMSSIELLYELRNCCDYIVASPTEILSDGFPYKDIVNSIFYNGGSLYNICERYMDFYFNNTESKQSASIALIDCKQIDALAEKVKQIYTAGVNEVNHETIQHLEGINNHVFFDMNQYIRALCNDDALYDEYMEQFNKTVLYKNNTQSIFSTYGRVNILADELDLCGVSTYIQRDHLPITKQYHQATKWWQYISQ